MYKEDSLLSKYRECQECKYKFILRPITLRFEVKNLSAPIYCPICNSPNTSIIPMEDFYK